MDREKVIKAIEDCVFHKNDCVDCDYDGCTFKHGDCRRDLLADALALLKEQEDLGTELTNAVELIHKKNERIEKLLKEQEEQKWKWLQTIADTQLAISPTGYESEDEMARRGWEWNGLQMAWEIIAGEECSEHPRLVRCNDCKYWQTNTQFCTRWSAPFATQHTSPNWYCADGERKSD